jgi:hypothetical protein
MTMSLLVNFVCDLDVRALLRHLVASPRMALTEKRGTFQLWRKNYRAPAAQIIPSPRFHLWSWVTTVRNDRREGANRADALTIRIGSRFPLSK